MNGMQYQKCRLPIVIAMLLIAGALSSCQKGSSGPAVVRKTSAAVLRILDINVWAGLDYEGSLWMGEYESRELRERRYQLLVRQIRALQVDIIGIHEANPLPYYARRLAGDLGFDEFHHTGVGGVRAGPIGLPWNLREGDALLIRRELAADSMRRRQLSGGPVGSFFTFHFSDATQVLGVRIANLSRPLWIFTTHWHASLFDTPPYHSMAEQIQREFPGDTEGLQKIASEMREGPAWRRQEAQRTVAFMREAAGPEPFILMGDFNATEDTREIAMLREAGLTDVFRALHPQEAGFTWDPGRNLNQRRWYSKEYPKNAYSVMNHRHEQLPRRIDKIFVGPAGAAGPAGLLRIRSARVVLNQPVDELHVSDHYGILAEIEMQP